MEFFKSNTKIPFMRQRYIAAIFSAILFIASLVSLSIYGLNFGLDFTGGVQVEAVYQQPVNLTQLRSSLKEGGFPQAVVQAHDSKDVTVRIGPHQGVKPDVLQKNLQQAMPGAKILSSQFIGPEVGSQLKSNGILAVVVALIATMIYIAIRFEYRFAISAALALIHDPVLILGIFSFWHLEFNMIVLMALLTVIGYSLNDTIVVYDRVRENFRKIRKGTPSEVMDISINQTLSRTIMTSGLTLLVVIALFLYGGDMIHGFAMALIIGIVIGTYSSIYVAGSLAIAFGLNRQSLLPNAKNYADDRP